MEELSLDRKVEFSGEKDPLTERIIRVFYEVYNELGYGFLESVYREAMRIALAEAGFRVEAEVPVPVSFCWCISGRYCCGWKDHRRVEDCGVDQQGA
jgi:hypothetical protein